MIDMHKDNAKQEGRAEHIAEPDGGWTRITRV